MTHHVVVYVLYYMQKQIQYTSTYYCCMRSLYGQQNQHRQLNSYTGILVQLGFPGLYAKFTKWSKFNFLYTKYRLSFSRAEGVLYLSLASVLDGVQFDPFLRKIINNYGSN
jgi:hypothetical protein